MVIDTLALGILLASGSAYGARQRARQLDLRESRLEAALARAQLDALRLEIQPHFLFNTLNSVSALIRLKEHDNALRMLIGLSDLLRAAVDQPKDQLVALTAELDFVRRYVDLQRVRFADRLDVRYADRRRLRRPGGAHVPAPAAGRERAAARGGAAAGRCVIWRSAPAPTAAACASGSPTTAPACRATSTSIAHAGTGLSNTRSRLAQLYGAAATFEVRAGKAAGTIVEIAFPASTPLAATAPAT